MDAPLGADEGGERWQMRRALASFETLAFLPRRQLICEPRHSCDEEVSLPLR
jgi:hypothetical protein